MDNTFLNIFAFILITILYYIALKPKLTIDILSNVDGYKKYNKSLYFNLGIYFLLVLLVQFGVNASIIINKCGGSVSTNIGMAGIMTFMPWVLIFGLVIVLLIVFPGFKGAFSDVIGYFYVSKKANDVLTDLLMDTNVYNKIDKVEDTSTPNVALYNVENQNGGDNKKALQDAADAIIKLCGNMSILINQIVPSNFLNYMDMLKPLMKPKYENDTSMLKAKEQELLDVVVTRDNIGEAFWYVYTAILLISIIQYNIASRPCVKDSAAMKANYQTYLSDQEAANKKAALSQGVYTIKN